MISSNCRDHRAALLATTTLALAMIAPATQAQGAEKSAQVARMDQTKSFAIPSGSLNDALAAFGAQSGMDVLADATTLQGVPSPGATGAMTPQEALSRILAGTKYTYAVSNNMVTILNQAQAAGSLPAEEVEVDADAYKKELGSPKYTAPLLDTPQTITIVPQQIIQDQKLLGLTQILSTLPGITFGAGEAAGGFGDNININGFTASNNIFVDGMRDDAQYSRTDSFDLESVELVNGADSAFGGVGGVGGAINLVSKTAKAGDFNLESLGAGTDNYYRFTADVNQQIDSETAVRLNLMAHENDVPGRDVENYKRWGVAPSIAFGLGTPTRFTLSYSHQHDDNIPQYGVPTFNGHILPGASWHAYYGFSNLDTQKIDTDFAQAVFEHDFSSNLTVRNQTRFENISQFSVVDPPAGTYCLADGLSPINSGSAIGTYGPCPSTVPAGDYLRSTGNVPGHLRNTHTQMIANETDVSWKFNTGFIEHTATIGAFFSHETLGLTDGSEERSANGTYYQNPPTSIADPNTIYSGPVNFVISNQAGYTQAHLDDEAIYGFDTMKFSDQWLFNFGVRLEHVNGSSQADIANITSTGLFNGVTYNPAFTNNNTLFSYRAGLMYKPQANGTIYFAYGNSTTPSMTSIDGSCTATTCSAAPQKAATYELGTKWQLLDNKLLLSGSLFRDDETNYLVADPGDPDNPSGVEQDNGSARVDGVNVGATGKITDKWSIFANYSLLSSQILQGVSNYQEAQGLDYTKGDPLTNVPKHSGSLWTTYEVTPQWQVGYGITDMGKVYIVDHSASYPTGLLPTTSGYTVSQAMIRYIFSKNFNLQLNVTNLFDKEYLTDLGPQNLRWAVPGDGRRAVLTLNTSF